MDSIFSESTFNLEPPLHWSKQNKKIIKNFQKLKAKFTAMNKGRPKQNTIEIDINL